MTRTRYWIAECMYPGKRPFTAGTVIADSELEAERKLHANITEVLPAGFTINAVFPGRVIVERDE